MYKVYFNKAYHPTLPDYYQYLSESLNLPNPHTFSLKRNVAKNSPLINDVSKLLIRDVDEFTEGLKLVLVRQKPG